MACVNVEDGELKARQVIMTNTATTVHFGQLLLLRFSLFLVDVTNLDAERLTLGT